MVRATMLQLQAWPNSHGPLFRYTSQPLCWRVTQGGHLVAAQTVSVGKNSSLRLRPVAESVTASGSSTPIHLHGSMHR